MRKVIVAVCVGVLAAVAAQAQGLGTVRDINDFGRKYMESQKNKPAQRRVVTKVKGKTDRLTKVLERKALLIQQEQQKKLTEKAAPAESTRVEKKSYPSYYYGREGKMMALSELTRQVASRKKAAKADKQQAARAEAAPKDTTEEEPSWWRAIFLGGRFPGETKEDYRARLSVQGLPAYMPFK